MCLHSTWDRALVVTLWAAEWFLTSVYSFMAAQFPFWGKCFLTYWTTQRSFKGCAIISSLVWLIWITTEFTFYIHGETDLQLKVLLDPNLKGEYYSTSCMQLIVISRGSSSTDLCCSQLLCCSIRRNRLKRLLWTLNMRNLLVLGYRWPKVSTITVYDLLSMPDCELIVFEN